MDFFTHQDQSRRRSLVLVSLFGVAVVLVVLAVYLAVQLVYYLTLDKLETRTVGFNWLDPQMFTIVALITVAVITVGCLVKMLQLKKGGSYVAEHLGGKRVNRLSANKDEKRLLNVVEEMAIASGVPVPQVYLMEEERGINAFAAGYTPSDAVVAVTRGCLEKLNREQLQGVVAHEFSHILNGDMRLNIRLIGFLYGIMVIALIGQGLLRGSAHSRRKGGGQAMVLALAFLVIGYVGQLLGRMIQSAVSRQREFLADASAVQFTRNPGGIAGALKRIGGFQSGSRVVSAHAHEVSHMFFSTAIQSFFATHPPLEERIRRIEPGFKGRLSHAGEKVSAPDAIASSVSQFETSYSRMTSDSTSMWQQVGYTTPEHVDYSAKLLSALPQRIRNELGDPLGAIGVVCSLLLDKDAVEREHQLKALAQVAPGEVIQQTLYIEKEIRQLQRKFHIPILELALPSIRCLSSGQRTALKRYLQVMMEADGKLTLFEFVLEKIVTHQLGIIEGPAMKQSTIKRMDDLLRPMVWLLSMLATSGHNDPKEAKEAFNAGFNRFRFAGMKQKADMDESVQFKDLGTAFDKLAQASTAIKRIVLDACSETVLFDRKTTIVESELLRATAAVMDIPVPPFLKL